MAEGLVLLGEWIPTGPGEGEMSEFDDADPVETQEWLDALNSLIENEGIERAQYILQRLSANVTKTGAQLPYAITTPYRNTIPVGKASRMPGDLFMES